jgi:hypothetical protein
MQQQLVDGRVQICRQGLTLVPFFNHIHDGMEPAATSTHIALVRFDRTRFPVSRSKGRRQTLACRFQVWMH